MRSIGLNIAAMMLAAIAAATAAQAETDWGKLSASVAVQSDYRYRGISQNSKQFTPEGSVNWSGPYGFYAGTWLAKTDWDTTGNPSFELDLFAGKHIDLDGTDLNIEAYYYSYPDAIFPVNASYYETVVQLSHTFDKLTLTAIGANSPEWSLEGGVAWYLAGTASYALTDWLSISGTVGHQWVKLAPSDYTHWDIGFIATYKSWTLDVRYVGNDIGSGNCSAFWMSTPKACQDTVMATLTYNISDLFQ